MRFNPLQEKFVHPCLQISLCVVQLCGKKSRLKTNTTWRESKTAAKVARIYNYKRLENLIQCAEEQKKLAMINVPQSLF